MYCGEHTLLMDSFFIIHDDTFIVLFACLSLKDAVSIIKREGETDDSLHVSRYGVVRQTFESEISGIENGEILFSNFYEDEKNYKKTNWVYSRAGRLLSLKEKLSVNM